MARGTIVVETDHCKGCELCTTVCPQDVLVISDFFNARGYKPAMLVDPEGKCTGCALCAVICPDAVITVYRLPNVAKMSRAPLAVASAMAA